MNMNGKGGCINPTELGEAKCCKIQGDPETTDSEIKVAYLSLNKTKRLIDAITSNNGN